MSSDDIDPVEFGKLIQAVETLTTSVATLTADVDALSAQLTGGKGIVVGLLIAAGGLGAGMSELFKKLLH